MHKSPKATYPLFGTINPLYMSMFLCSVLTIKLFKQARYIRKLERKCENFERVIHCLETVIKDYTWITNISNKP